LRCAGCVVLLAKSRFVPAVGMTKLKKGRSTKTQRGRMTKN
jgi:hypothetical protein